VPGIAVVGCGHWGANYVRLLRAMHVTPLVACDPDQSRLNGLLERYPGIETTIDYSAAVTRDDVDAVVIATTAAHHHEIASAVIAAGKDLLVEKPLTLRTIDGNDLVLAADDRGLILMVGHTFLYNPAIRMMREYLVRGDVGSVYYLHATRTHLGLVRSDVNAVWDLATHDISIFGYLLDARPERVSAVGARYLSQVREDVAFISLTYPGGVIANIFVSWVDSNKTRQIAVVGSRARLLFDDLNNLERLRLFEKGVSLDRPYADFGEFQLLVRDGNIVSPRVDSTEPLRLQTEHFLEAIAERKRPLTDGRAGVEVVTILEAIDESLQRAGAPVEPNWPDEDGA